MSKFAEIDNRLTSWWFRKNDYSQNIRIIIFSTITGSFYVVFLILLALVPTNVGWLLNGGDPTQHYLGWLFYRADPSWHFPLTVTDRLFYPTGLSISFTDSFPLLAIAAKLLSNFLPERFQYFGFAILLSHVLQLYFGIRIGQVISKNNLIFSLLSGLLILLAPPLTWRFVGHIALANHWVILCSLWLYLKDYKVYTDKTVLIPQICLLVITTAIHPYLLFMVILLSLATYSKLVMLKKCSLKKVRDWLFWSFFALFLAFLSLGYISSATTEKADGYGTHSLNLLSLFNSMGVSVVLPKIPNAFEEQTEGYNYLGLGVILLLFSNLINIKNSLKFLFTPSLLPLTITCTFLTLYAITNTITIGAFQVVSIWLPDFVIKYLSIFRATGRLFWPVYYLIVIGILLITFQYLPRFQAYILMILVVCIQFVDLAPLRSDIRFWTNKPQQLSSLVSPEWSKIYQHHSKLMVLPAYQCGLDASPGEDYIPFAYLAANQNLLTNNFRVSRLGKQQQEIHCNKIIHEVESGILDNDAAYVLTKDLYTKMTLSGKVTSHVCSTVDGFILCQKKV